MVEIQLRFMALVLRMLIGIAYHTAGGQLAKEMNEANEMILILDAKVKAMS